MTEEARKEIVMTYLKQLHLNRMARDCAGKRRRVKVESG